MDISFIIGEEKFNYRVCAVILKDGEILAMRDERSPYYYLPGGRVHLGERAEDAVIRELREELNITPEVVRPLWLCQSFFKEDVNGLRYHEICIYFLTDISQCDLLDKGHKFTISERTNKNTFEWLKFEQLQNEYIYPLFIKKEIFNLFIYTPLSALITIAIAIVTALVSTTLPVYKIAKKCPADSIRTL